MYRYWFIHGGKCIILIYDVKKGETGCEVYGNSVLSSQFLCKSKTFLKFKNLFFKRRDKAFPGGPVGKTPHSQCGGPEFHPWSGN